jgi:hypothetical protein
MRILLGIAMMLAAGNAFGQTTVLQRVFFDDFSGDLGQWDLSHMAGGVASINGSQQLEVNDDGPDPRGFLLTNFSTDSSFGLSTWVEDGEVYMRIAFDVIAGTTHSTELLVGATPGSGTDSVTGTHTLSPLGDPSGSGRAHAHGTFSTSVNAGPSNSGLNSNSTQSAIGKNVRLDWVRRLPGEGQQTRRVDIYYDDVLEITFDEPVDASRLDFGGGPAGFYVLLDRDFTIDNFEILQAVSEPVTISFTNIIVEDTAALEFNTTPGVTYRLQSTTNLQATGWVSSGTLILGAGGTQLAFDPTGFSTSKTYRIIVQ